MNKNNNTKGEAIARAPLYPLSDIQRLGYLDEQKTIACKKDLRCFRAGGIYPLRHQLIQLQRTGTKLNINGGIDKVEWTGSELGFFIKCEGPSSSREYLFMDGRLRDPSFKLIRSVTDAEGRVADKVPPVLCAINFTLQELVDHFVIPDVPDVAALDPEGYQRNLKMLEEIECLCQ